MSDNPYLSILEEDAQRAAALRGSLNQALPVAPDTQARVVRAGRQLGAPAAAASVLPDEVQREARVRQIEADTAQAPVLRSKYTDADWAKLAHDDSGPLSALESGVARAMRYVMGADRGGGLPGDLAAAVRFGAPAGAAGVGRAASELVAPLLDVLEPVQAIGGNPLRRLADGFGMIAEANRAALDARANPEDGLVMGGVRSGVRSLGQNLLTMPLAFLPGGQAAALTGMSAMAGGESYQKAREKGLTPGPALAYGASDAVVEFATERMPLAKLLGDIKAGAPLATAMAKNAMHEVPGEQLATVLQDLNEWAALNPEQTFKDYLAERPGAAAQTLIATLVGSGGQVALVHGMQRAADGIAGFDRQAAMAPRQAEALQELAKLAEASKLRERDPESFAAFMQEAAAEHAPTVYVDVQALVKAGVNLDEVAQALPSVATALAEAAATGGDVAIPTGELLAAAPGQTFAQALIDHGRLAPDAMSKAEAEQYMAERGDQVQAEVQRALQAQQQDDQALAERDQVQADVLAQLNEAGRFRPNVNEAYATLVADFYAVQGAKLGLSAAEMARRYPLRITAQSAPGAQVLEQADRVRPELQALAEAALAAGNENRTVELGPVGSEAAAEALRAGLDLTGYRHTVDMFAVRHTLREHGSAEAEAARGQLPVTAADIAALPDAIQSPDARVYGVKNKRGQDLVASIKRQADGTALVIEEVRVGRRTLALASMRKYPAARDFDSLAGTLLSNARSDGGDALIVVPQQRTLEQSARGQIALGQDITATPSTITLLQGADLSTFLHELGHFFLAVQADMAARTTAQATGGASLTDADRALQADMATLLEWFGIKDTPERSALDQWFDMTPDQQRPYHEQFARGFEAYAFEGQAPSQALQGIFQRFRAWLTQIYRKLSALDVQLTDEVRQVMDRMLASDDAIRQAEAARKLAPMFQTPEQAGMTPAEWAAYNERALDATATALERLQARGLRDMQWLSNARGRKLKELQAQHDEIRREVRMQARAEVLQRPIYQAWRFLTGRGPQDLTAQGTPPRRGGQMLDPAQDSLLVAIAKLGGISRESARRDLGVAADDLKAQSGVFGKPVFHASGGRTADDMAVALMEFGYIFPDEQGQHSLHDLEDKVAAELRGDLQYSASKAWEERGLDPLAEGVEFGKINTEALREMYGTKPDALWRTLSARRMTSDTGVDPEVVAQRFGFDSGDALVRALAEAEPPGQVIEALTDQRMLEQHGDLATPEGLARAADAAIHTEARARFIATELDALERANNVREKIPGTRRTVDVLARAARQTAEAVIARLKVRDIKPAKYAAAETRAARAAETAMRKGQLAEAAEAKRVQLIQHRATGVAHAAVGEVESTLRYLRKLTTGKRSKTIDGAYLDQIEQLLEGTDLKARTLREVDRRASLAEWIEHVRDNQHVDPDIPPELLKAAGLKSWRDMTLEELRGLRDTVQQIEHLGRMKNRLLTAQDQREFEAARDELAAGILANADGRQARTRSPATLGERWADAVRGFKAAHIKAAGWARIFDGGKDGGPAWEYLIRSANDAGNRQTRMRAEATERLNTILAPVMGQRLQARPQHFPTLNRSLTREQVVAIALNLGNEGNRQRLLDGEGWTLPQLQPVLQTLTAAEWQAVQGVWDHFESYRPQIAAKQRRVYGTEPQWVDPMPMRVRTADGQQLDLRGGYFPVRYDPAATAKAEQHADAENAKAMMSAAYMAATTRRSYTKTRADQVVGRPLLLSLSGVWSGVEEVTHDLAWHEWVIDASRLLRSDKVDRAIRENYGPEATRQLKRWVQDVAAGEKGLTHELDGFLGRLRHGVSAAGLAFNVMSALTQPIGITQSVQRIGARWVGRGLAQYLAAPVERTRWMHEQSTFMADRARTRWRELNELRNQVEGQTAFRQWMARYGWWMMSRVQQMVDVPTWLGAYEKAISEGETDARAVALADQATIDAQGSGMLKDLSAIERGGPAQKLFTVFYTFFNTAYNLATVATRTARTPAQRARLAVDYALLFVAPAILTVMLKDALAPGDSGDWEDWEKLSRKLITAQLDYLMGMMVGVREFAPLAKMLADPESKPTHYTGPAGLRPIEDVGRLVVQARQGEFDDAFRKALVQVLGDAFALPAAQINRSITGAQALADGKTDNPAAIIFGYQEPK